MKVLLISANTLPASPSGPAYVAGAVRQAGHVVEVYEALFAVDLASELSARLQDLQPDVVRAKKLSRVFSNAWLRVRTFVQCRAACIAEAAPGVPFLRARSKT